MAAERECPCCKNLPLWAATGVTRSSNAGHWTGGSPGSGTYARNWLSDGVWGGGSDSYYLSTREYLFTQNSSSELQQWRADYPHLLQTSPSVIDSGTFNNRPHSLFDNKLHVIDQVYTVDVSGIEIVDAYCSVWDLATNTMDIDDSLITSFLLDGVELFPLAEEGGANGTVGSLFFAVTPESNNMMVQVAYNTTGNNWIYESHVGTYAITALSSTECRITFTTDVSGPSVTLSYERTTTPAIHEAHDGTIYYHDSIAGDIRFVNIPGFSYNSTTPTTTTFAIASRLGYVSSYRQGATNWTFETVAPDGDYTFTVPAANVSAFDFSLRLTSNSSRYLPAMMGGKWCINAKPTLSAANTAFPDLITAFDSDDTESDGDVDLTKFVFNHDFTEVERRVSWNWGPVEPGGRYSPGHDGFEASSPFYYLVSTKPDHNTALEDIFEDYSDGIFTVPADQYATIVQYDAGIPGVGGVAPHTNHYDLESSSAEFDIRFIEAMKTSAFGSSMVYHEVNDLTEDMILVLATGTVTHDPIDPSDITTSDNKTWSVTVNNVSGGEDGGLLTLTLRADKELYGTPDDAEFGYLPPRVPAVYQEFYDVPPA